MVCLQFDKRISYRGSHYKPLLAFILDSQPVFIKYRRHKIEGIRVLIKPEKIYKRKPIKLLHNVPKGVL